MTMKMFEIELSNKTEEVHVVASNIYEALRALDQEELLNAMSVKVLLISCPIIGK